MLEVVVPAVRNSANFNFDLFVLLVIRFVVGYLYFFLFRGEFVIGTRAFE